MSNMYAIHRHLATELDNRLALLRQIPKQIVVYGADGACSRTLLAARYPQALLQEYDARAAALVASQSHSQSSWLAKLKGKKVTQYEQDWLAPLPEAQADMLWANLSLMQSASIVPVLENWARALKTDGTLFFTHLGRDSLPEIHALLQANGVSATAPTWVDMHDLADMLFHNGFYDPVVDTFELRLVYQTGATLLADLDTLGIWQALLPENPAVVREIVAKNADKIMELTLQTVFGHAIKKLMLPENEQLVRFMPRAK
ncbi:MAG: methyltransferase [Alysiella sp.]|uniref:class I SAM-dependent methyltransferase n=1 Tax=Alysiella sp. TaxID=1872483 RepID=UPI0026DDA547|nr:methyltransferase [Alysiella sp.]MDO4432973.1 methyltransferase [Alysiella sp.]